MIQLVCVSNSAGLIIDGLFWTSSARRGVHELDLQLFNVITKLEVEYLRYLKQLVITSFLNMFNLEVAYSAKFTWPMFVDHNLCL